jgi:hypothetical protein
MKQKLFISLLLVTLILSVTGTAFAQEPVPAPSGEATTLSKNEAGLSRKAQDSQQPLPFQSSSFAIATTPLVNGDFEQGPFVGWSEGSTHNWQVVNSAGDLAAVGIVPHGGNWAAWLGGDDDDVSYIAQGNITITSPTSLRLWYWIGSEDDCNFDYGYVWVNTDIIYTWNLCQSTNTAGWVPLNLSLDAYNGQTVILAISVETDQAANSNLFIDDVSLYKTFADVPYGYWSESFIYRLYNAGVTSGCATSPLMYCPGTAVTRDQMAVFLLKGKYGSGYVPPAVGGSTGFSDVPTDYWAAAWIKQLAAEGVTAGCGGGNYCPGTAVTRDQMAVFLLKAEHGSSYVPPTASGMFNDVPANYWAAPWIEQLAVEGITGGCGGGSYCPGTAVTRDQMAVFLVKTFNLP